MSAPIPYSGGKTRLATQIVARMPDHTWYVEVFAGAAAVFSSKKPRKTEVKMTWTGNLYTPPTGIQPPGRSASTVSEVPDCQRQVQSPDEGCPRHLNRHPTSGAVSLPAAHLLRCKSISTEVWRSHPWAASALTFSLWRQRSRRLGKCWRKCSSSASISGSSFRAMIVRTPYNLPTVLG